MPHYRYSADLADSKERSKEETDKMKERIERANTLLSCRWSEATASVDLDHLERHHAIQINFSENISEHNSKHYESSSKWYKVQPCAFLLLMIWWKLHPILLQISAILDIITSLYFWFHKLNNLKTWFMFISSVGQDYFICWISQHNAGETKFFRPRIVYMRLL